MATIYRPNICGHNYNIDDIFNGRAGAPLFKLDVPEHDDSIIPYEAVRAAQRIRENLIPETWADMAAISEEFRRECHFVTKADYLKSLKEEHVLDWPEDDEIKM